MLLQRLRSVEASVEAAIAYNLVDLALAAPNRLFEDIIRTFSMANRLTDPSQSTHPNNMVGCRVLPGLSLTGSTARFSPRKHDSLKS